MPGDSEAGANAGQRFFFDKFVRRHDHRRTQLRGITAGKNQGNAAAIVPGMPAEKDKGHQRNGGLRDLARDGSVVGKGCGHAGCLLNWDAQGNAPGMQKPTGPVCFHSKPSTLLHLFTHSLTHSRVLVPTAETIYAGCGARLRRAKSRQPSPCDVPADGLYSRLRVYGAARRKAELQTMLLGAVDEFKSACVTIGRTFTSISVRVSGLIFVIRKYTNLSGLTPSLRSTV